MAPRIPMYKRALELVSLLFLIFPLLNTEAALEVNVGPDSAVVPSSHNPVVLAIRGWQLLSKNSHGLIRCQFSPSCSEFTIESIRNKGTIRGILAGADRISRCHPLASRYYVRDSQGKLTDPAHSRPYFQSTRCAAATMPASLIVPGLNKMANGRFYDGLTTFVVTGVLCYCMCESYENKSVLRIPFTLGFCTFYASDAYVNLQSIRRDDKP